MRRHPLVLSVQHGLSVCGVNPGDRVLIAASAGPDSTALLHALAALADRGRWTLDLHVAHVHHHLREPHADHDAAAARAHAEALDLPFHLSHIRPAAEPGNLEHNARRLRYDALAAIAADIDADAIATAHHRHDQLETILMRLMRGSSARGLAAMAPRRRLAQTHLIRPMLDADPADARDLLKQFDIAWNTDHTNLATDRTRAALRQTVLPPLLEIFPDGPAAAARSAAQLRRLASLVERLARRAHARHVTLRDGVTSLDRNAAARLPRPILAQLLRDISIARGVNADRLPARLIDDIAAAIRATPPAPRTFNLAAHIDINVSRTDIRWLPRAPHESPPPALRPDSGPAPPD